MRRLLFSIAVLLSLAGRAGAVDVGFQLVSVPDPPGPPLSAAIWYPTTAAPADRPLALFVQPVAVDGPVSGRGLGLVVISHGHSGSLENHYDTALALARAGFVVAAVTHTGDNWRDLSLTTDLPPRTRAMHALVGYMLADWPGHASIAQSRVGMFGFSIGAFTTLVSIGGVPDLGRTGPFCSSHPASYSCVLAREHPAARVPIAADWVREPRIRAAVVVAPALGYTFAPSGLAGVRIPVQLWRGGQDHILPSPDYAEPVRDALPQAPDYRVATGADHYDFLAPCSEDLAHYAPEICAGHGGFSRAAFHKVFNAAVVRFFERALR